MVELLTGRLPDDDEKPRENPPDDLVLAAASWVSLCHRLTTSRAIGRRWYDDTRAEDDTEGFLSTIAVFMTRSMDWTVVAWEGQCQHWESRLSMCVGGASYINNATERPNSVGTVDGVGAAACVLHDGARDHDNVLGRAGELLDDEVDHLAQAGILILEELRDAEEEGGGFGGRELLARVEEEGDLCEKDTASSRLDGRVVEESSCGPPI
jgi:hypothetical protein